MGNDVEEDLKVARENHEQGFNVNQCSCIRWGVTCGCKWSIGERGCFLSIFLIVIYQSAIASSYKTYDHMTQTQRQFHNPNAKDIAQYEENTLKRQKCTRHTNITQ